MPTSPNSLTTTAVLAPSGRSSRARIRVVLPAPRKPVTTTTGSLGPRARRWRRPNSVPAKGDNSAKSAHHRLLVLDELPGPAVGAVCGRAEAAVRRGTLAAALGGISEHDHAVAGAADRPVRHLDRGPTRRAFEALQDVGGAHHSHPGERHEAGPVKQLLV